MKLLRSILIVSILLVLCLPSAGLAAPTSTTITVNTQVDELTVNSACSLREAVISANTVDSYGCTRSGSGSLVISVPAGDYHLTRTESNPDESTYGDLDILVPLTIHGAGLDLTNIYGYGTERVLDIRAALAETVILNDLTIRDGFASGAEGGGIRNYASLTLENVSVFSNSSTLDGGGIMNHGSSLTLTNSTVNENTANGNGGGIYNDAGSTLTVDHCTLNQNTSDSNTDAIGNGGGIYNVSVQNLYVYDSTFYYNSAGRGNGGAIYSGAAGGDEVLISDSRFDTNQAIEGSGGAVMHAVGAGSLEIYRSEFHNGRASRGAGIFSTGTGNHTYVENTTIDGNLADRAPRQGAGIFIDSGTVEIVHATIANNTAGDPGLPGSGAGLYLNTGTVTIRSTILSWNTDREAHSINCTGAIDSLGYNLSNDSSCSLDATGDMVASTGLATRALNNSLNGTYTLSLYPYSPAIDSADTTGCPATDQRGMHRPADGDDFGGARCDIGAFESFEHTFLPAIRQ